MGAAVIPALIIGSSLLATGVGVAGQVQQANAAQAQAKYQSQVAKNNAIIASQRAEDATARGEFAARQEGIRTRAAIGAERARAAGSGVLVDTGSNLAIQQDIAGAGALNQLNIRRNAELEAMGYQQQGQSFRNEAELRQFAGRNAQTAGAFRAASTTITGASSVADKWYAFNQAGAFG